MLTIGKSTWRLNGIRRRACRYSHEVLYAGKQHRSPAILNSEHAPLSLFIFRLRRRPGAVGNWCAGQHDRGQSKAEQGKRLASLESMLSSPLISTYLSTKAFASPTNSSSTKVRLRRSVELMYKSSYTVLRSGDMLTITLSLYKVLPLCVRMIGRRFAEELAIAVFLIPLIDHLLVGLHAICGLVVSHDTRHTGRRDSIPPHSITVQIQVN
ncbi:hypothetical protein B0I35DRAFT_245489 [Stachybotrys elegans]|uniref:Uncharacterized protein n=1 Tax=Stachybotrys elegans TaxID=80388 RepID=A0A8K0WQN2_9HYPO|nr:hypothetical protein B0I35DRAFT_245489 [Stachybotrys elegans]